MELNEYWSAQAVDEYKGMLHEQKMQNYVLACELQAPHVIHKAEVKQDGNMWCCILGDLPTGVVGFGTTPKKRVMNLIEYGTKDIRQQISNFKGENNGTK